MMLTTTYVQHTTYGYSLRETEERTTVKFNRLMIQHTNYSVVYIQIRKM